MISSLYNRYDTKCQSLCGSKTLAKVGIVLFPGYLAFKLIRKVVNKQRSALTKLGVMKKIPSEIYSDVFIAKGAVGLSDMGSASDITYDVLKESIWTDHVKVFKKVFSHTKIDSFLEFGLGKGTKYFLDNCKNVTSIELIVPDRRKEIEPWYHACIELYKDFKNWHPKIHVFSNTMNMATRLAERHLNPQEYDTSYLKEVNAFVTEELQKKKYDLAFVDAGVQMRGDFVNALFNKVDIIAAHDTNPNCKNRSLMYGWYRVKTPKNYTKIEFNQGSGVILWIKNTREDLIKKLT